MRHKIIFHETKSIFIGVIFAWRFSTPPPHTHFSCIPSSSKMFLFYQQKKPHAICYSTCVRVRNKHTYMLHIIYKKKHTAVDEMWSVNKGSEPKTGI